MTEQEIKDRLAELYAKQKAATSWGAAVGARHEEIKSLEGQLAASRRTTQSPADMADDAPFVQGQSERNWTEDASHENGNYECRCCECDQMFIGHKRRVLCKACSKLLTPAHSTLGGGNGEAVAERLLQMAENMGGPHAPELRALAKRLFAAPQPRDDAGTPERTYTLAEVSDTVERVIRKMLDDGQITASSQHQHNEGK